MSKEEIINELKYWLNFEAIQINKLEVISIIKLIEGIQQENQELKEKLDKIYKGEIPIIDQYHGDAYLTQEMEYQVRKKLEAQQKEFIDWLEKEIKVYDEDIQRLRNDKNHNYYLSLISCEESGMKAYKEVLKMYKEIIGVDENEKD